MSDTHAARVVRIGEIRPHPNADRLALTTIGEGAGWQMVIGKDTFKTGDLAVYIQPDSIVPQTEPFKFIWQEHVGIDGKVPESRRRIKPKRLRKEWSEGLLMPLTDFATNAPNGVEVGEDIASLIGITHYVPEFDRESTTADTAAAPKRRYPKTLKGWFYFLLYKIGFKGARKNYALDVTFTFPVYDVDALKNAGSRGFRLGEPVRVTEKIHGSNARYVVIDGVQYCGSRQQWKSDGPNVWWNAYRQHPEIGEWCKAHPGEVLYGEVGPTQKHFDYGCKEGETFFYAFDVFNGKMSWAGGCANGGAGFAPTVPVLYQGPYDSDAVLKLVDGPSTLTNRHIREGVVIESLETGRKLKVVSNDYLNKN